MNTKTSKSSNLIEDGMQVYEKTEAFRLKALSIKKEIKEKYADMISRESTLLKKLLLQIKMNIEIRKKLQEISSSRNLHVMAPLRTSWGSGHSAFIKGAGKTAWRLKHN